MERKGLVTSCIWIRHLIQPMYLNNIIFGPLAISSFMSIRSSYLGIRIYCIIHEKKHKNDFSFHRKEIKPSVKDKFSRELSCWICIYLWLKDIWGLLCVCWWIKLCASNQCCGSGSDLYKYSNPEPTPTNSEPRPGWIWNIIKFNM